MRKGNCSNLLDGSPESFYWLGFLLADGHFSKNTRIKISIGRKDRDHLEKLALFLNTSIKDTESKLGDKHYEQCSLSIMHGEVVRHVTDRYKIQPNKTKNPPNLDSMDDISIFACSIGFLDGDGSIGFQSGRSDCIVRIKCHSSWSSVLKKMYPCFSHGITSDGYARCSLSNSVVIKDIKRRCIELGLPVLNRKWDKVDLELVGRTEMSGIRKKDIHYLLEQNCSIVEICKRLNLKYSTVYMIIKRNKL